MPGVIEKAYLVPGLPHLVFGDSGWAPLKEAYAKAGEQVKALKPDVLVVYSAQWISVLGHSFQADPNPKGLHVDENWYDMGEFPFSFKTDVDLTNKAEEMARGKGLATKLVNYQGFPIDTGTLVALKYFNPDNSIPVMIVSSNIYCGQEDSKKLGEAVGEAIKQSGKRAVLINCSSLSHRFFTTDINPAEDKIAKPEDDQWNLKVLDLMKQGKNGEVFDLGPEYAKAANPEMAFKGFYWMMGAMGTPSTPAEVLAYGPVWGTGAAVVQYSLN
jgi:2-aminophenol/2-amino-5-chlorophenol 1,6-dioxygenase subunit alpha